MRNGLAINASHKAMPNVYQYLALTLLLPSFNRSAAAPDCHRVRTHETAAANIHPIHQKSVAISE